jgi:hypothetical protein
MRTHKVVLAAALAAGIATAVPAAANADAGSHHSKGAHAAGVDAPPVLPAAVRVRIKRGENALDKAGEYVDKGAPEKAVNSLRGARSNMYAAWRAAKYGIENAPPPPAEDKSVAHASQDDPVGPVYATPEETAIAVLGYQHDVVSSTMGLVDGAKGTLRDQLSRTLFAAMDRRDSAITYIHTITPPVVEDKLVAHASQDDAAVGFDVLMPGVIPDLDDEQAQGAEILAGGALTPGEKRIVRLANAQSVQTENTVNTFWPPATEG